MVVLGSDVGRMCANQKADVRTVQMLLNHWNYVLPYGQVCLLENGEANATTIQAIELFERNVLGLPSTGVVRPLTRVWDALAAGEPWTDWGWRPTRTRNGRGEAWVRDNFGDFSSSFFGVDSDAYQL